MRILFTSGKAFLPQTSGGVQSSTMQLAQALMARGHAVAVLCRLTNGGWTQTRSGLERKLLRRRFSRDTGLGLPVFRSWDPTDASEVVRRFRPDVAVVQSGGTVPIARSLEAAGVPVALYFRHVEFDDLEGDPSTLRAASYVANSAFTAARHEARFGVRSTVIPPLVDPDLYRTETSRENVTFINPYPAKGRDIAFDLAERCPDIPFAFYESWHIHDELRAWIDARLARLPNVTMHPRTSDMKTVYAKARVLLAPSVWEEAWGRVATEAQFSGIPVLGSGQGGLPEAIGPGGAVVDVDAPREVWVAALRRLWDDPAHYAALSRAALDHAGRDAIAPGRQIDALIGVLERAVAGGAPPPA